MEWIHEHDERGRNTQATNRQMWDQNLVTVKWSPTVHCHAMGQHGHAEHIWRKLATDALDATIVSDAMKHLGSWASNHPDALSLWEPQYRS